MSELRETKGEKFFNIIEKNAVSILFLIICAVGIAFRAIPLATRDKR